MAVVRSSVQLRYLQFDDLWSTGNNTHAHTHTSTGQDRTDMCSVSQKCHKTFCTKKKEGKNLLQTSVPKRFIFVSFPALPSVAHFRHASVCFCTASPRTGTKRPSKATIRNTPRFGRNVVSTFHFTDRPIRCPTTKNGSPKHTFRALSLRFEYELFDHNEPLHCEAVL